MVSFKSILPSPSISPEVARDTPHRPNERNKAMRQIDTIERNGEQIVEIIGDVP